jgi:hypothetical protein
MKKKLAAIAFAGASLAMFAGAPSAGAAHCLDNDAAPTSPGYSYFGTDHVKLTGHASEGVNPETGLGPHAGTPGASNCHVTAGNPSGQAPGRN